MVGGKLAPECAKRWASYTDATQNQYFRDYGVVLSGGSKTQRAAIVVAVGTIGANFQGYLPGMSGAQAFKYVYDKVNITFSGEGNGCDASSGTGFVCGVSSDSVPELYTHELAHTLNVALKGSPYDSLSSVDVRDDDNNIVFQAIRADRYIRTRLGYKGGGPPYMYHGPTYWSDWDSNNNYTALHEDFADMFMNWNFNSFSDDSAGTARYDWMTTHLAEWIH